MKKFIFALLVLAIMLGGIAGQAAYAAVDCTKNSSIDDAGDWLATLGKKDMEKDQILVKRKADRMAACTKREAEKAAKQAQKAAGDMKKKLGF
ncbi:MAG TPA: hypothetical protein PLL75_04525 [Candidatus Omnitrophota bacterium]|nr:hypothetical protein [Candidatus Omnitrophota bacterium]HPS36976.1 hypothetical protein [Candidatus Omnitrophota bacterium]